MIINRNIIDRSFIVKKSLVTKLPENSKVLVKLFNIFHTYNFANIYESLVLPVNCKMISNRNDLVQKTVISVSISHWQF